MRGMSAEVLIAALRRAGRHWAAKPQRTGRAALTKATLYELGLSGRPDSAARRREL